MTILVPERTEMPSAGARPSVVPAWGHSVVLVVAAALAMALAVAVLVAGATPAAAQASGPAPALTGGLECPPEASGGDAKGALMETFIPDEGPGCFPTSAYRVDFDDGDWKAISRKVLGSSTEFIAGLGRWLVGASLWIVSWAFTFGFAANLAQPFADLAGRYQSSYAAPLVHFALVITATYAAWHTYRGRLTRGLGEFGLSLLILALCGTFLLSRPKAFLDGSIKAVGSLSGAVVSTAVECGAECQSVSYTCTTRGEFEANPDACGSEYVFNQYKGLIQPLERGVHRAFVEQPYELVQWGQFVEDGVCRDRMNQILAKGPGGDRDQIVNIMANGKMGESAEDRLKRSGGSGFALFFDRRDEDKPDGQCDDLYAFNREPTMERLGVAALTLISSLIILVLLVLVAGTIVAAQLVAVALIAVLPFAVLGGALPGGGRQALWRWAASFARALLAIVAMSMCLAFLLVTSNSILSSQSSQGLLVRMVTLNAVTITAFVARRRFLEAGQRLATTFGQRLGQMSVGGQGAGWMGPAAVGGLTGFALARQMREGAVDGQEIVRPVVGTVRRRVHNRQQAGAYAKAIGARGGGYSSGVGGSGGEPVGVPDGGGAGQQQPGSYRRPATSGSRAGQVAKTGAKVAWGATLGAPVEVPRAYRAARQAVSSKSGSVRSRLQQRRTQAWDYVEEGAENLATLVPGVRAHRAQEAQEAARRAEAAERRAAEEREEAMEWA
jgi:hypothetical protein